ncbi:MAG: DUF427 domain-containing protein [Acidimicrobiia bacterium]|nr:MAG: DUF427 domain-containing protein [Acidimicrobiia bacterium]
MAKAVWRGVAIAESDDTVVVDGYHYFPEASVNQDLLAPSDRSSVCHWKGAARYHDVVVGGETLPAAAWYYPDPSPAAMRVAGRIAFWRGVEVQA